MTIFKELEKLIHKGFTYFIQHEKRADKCGQSMSVLSARNPYVSCEALQAISNKISTAGRKLFSFTSNCS